MSGKGKQSDTVGHAKPASTNLFLQRARGECHDDDRILVHGGSSKSNKAKLKGAATAMSRSWNRSTGCPIHPFSLVVCRHPESGYWLAVNETEGRGWWLPGGFVEPGESHHSAAVRETQEEAGIDVQLKGILRVENDIQNDGGRQRVIFYAEPQDPIQQPKQNPDKESLGAAWMSVVELRAKSRLPPPECLRGTELLDWALYIEGGGIIYPLDVFASEHEPVPKPGRK